MVEEEEGLLYILCAAQNPISKQIMIKGKSR